MKIQHLLLIALLIGVPKHSVGQSTDSQSKAIVENAIKAMGGMVFLKSVKTLYSDCKTQMNGLDVNWITKEMVPDKGSFAVVFQGNTVYRSWYDGTNGYEIVDGKKQLADQKAYEDKKYRKNIFNEIDYLDPTLYTLQYVGEEKIGEAQCHKIKAICASGKTDYLYFDKKSGLLFKSETLAADGKSVAAVSFFENYKPFGKLTYYSGMRFGDGKEFQTATIVEMKYNENVSQKDFE